MSQSNYIAAALAIAFLVFVTMRGSLSKYIGILTGDSGFGQDTASAGNAPQETTSTADSGKPADKTTETASDASKANPALSLLQQVQEHGGQADEMLDAVKMFDLAGFI